MPIESFRLAPSEGIPNHPAFPVLVHRGAVTGAGKAAALEALFAANGWPPRWRDGIFGFDHYHTEGHEALGIAEGSARVLLGGPGGREVALAAGDVAVLPAGTGHRLLEGDPELLVVGAYPPGQHADICREPASAAMLARVRALAAPAFDPAGRSPGVRELWGAP